MFKQSYTQKELDEIISNTSKRRGWDFSCMNTTEGVVTWDYLDVVKQYLKPTDKVLDIGTGGGESFIKLASHFKSGIGIDLDPKMVQIANENKKEIDNIIFCIDSEKLENTKEKFNVILNCHAPFNPKVISRCLVPGGIFITQQVAKKNMFNIKKILNHKSSKPTGSKKEVLEAGLTILESKEYDIEYIVKDIESLVFWLKSLDMLHADIQTDKVVDKSSVLNNILKGNLDKRGFITNKHRYLLIAQKS